jgi:hypothetical protein
MDYLRETPAIFGRARGSWARLCRSGQHQGRGSLLSGPSIRKEKRTKGGTLIHRFGLGLFLAALMDTPHGHRLPKLAADTARLFAAARLPSPRRRPSPSCPGNYLRPQAAKSPSRKALRRPDASGISARKSRFICAAYPTPENCAWRWSAATRRSGLFQRGVARSAGLGRTTSPSGGIEIVREYLTQVPALRRHGPQGTLWCSRPRAQPAGPLFNVACRTFSKGTMEIASAPEIARG